MSNVCKFLQNYQYKEFQGFYVSQFILAQIKLKCTKNT